MVQFSNLQLQSSCIILCNFASDKKENLSLDKSLYSFNFRNMRKVIGIIALVLAGSLSTMAQTTNNSMNRIETCKQNYYKLFGNEALTGQGTDSQRGVAALRPPGASGLCLSAGGSLLHAPNAEGNLSVCQHGAG